MKITKHISIIVWLLISSFAVAQVKFEAKVSKQKLGVNERLRIDFEMNKDGDNFNPPSFSGFTVVGGPNQSVSNSWINGVRTYKKTYSYFLAPKKRGTFTIAQASITIDGETYKTTPVKVEVTAAVDIPKDPNDPSYIASESIHLVAEVSKTDPYLNEAITIVYKLYVSPKIAVDNWNELDSPRYNDFWSQNINTQGQKVQNGTYKGEDYRYLVLRKTVLYPQKTGKLNIEPLTLDIAMRVPTNRRDIFGSRLMTRVNKTISAGNKTIHVKSLPEAGKPIDFTGAVGSDFRLNVSASKTELDATESLQIKVSVKGKGNLKLFKLPKISLPSSLEVYEPEHKEQIKTNLTGMQGSISDSYTVVPQYKGKYPIPSISFSYFDLKTERYKRLSSEEIVIDVLNGPSSNNASSDNAAVSNNKQAIVLNSDQFAFIKTKTNFSSINPTYFFKTKAFWSLVILPFLAIPLAIVIRNRKASRDADVYGNRIRKADRLARKYLKGAKKSLGQKEAFYIALEKALHNYLKAKLHIETSDLSKDKIINLLKGKQVAEEVINDFVSIIESCELARYTPIDHVTMQEDYEKAAKTISLIDKQAR
ncbi:BatD family protein [Seonamhaeicola sp.]|uniref:BatD family protein n=1 Tax=Seonamhaeicola sp. TaxID=1912245 RepID=UPI00261AB8ED|nr:BatD family protein [Seonamhaeicola sp.]